VQVMSIVSPNFACLWPLLFSPAVVDFPNRLRQRTRFSCRLSFDSHLTNSRMNPLFSERMSHADRPQTSGTPRSRSRQGWAHPGRSGSSASEESCCSGTAAGFGADQLPWQTWRGRASKRLMTSCRYPLDRIVRIGAHYTPPLGLKIKRREDSRSGKKKSLLSLCQFDVKSAGSRNLVISSMRGT
jgi:hypothetical protein